MPHFITAVLKKTIADEQTEETDLLLDTSKASDIIQEPKTEEESESDSDKEKGFSGLQDVTDDYYGIGTYCSVQYNPSNSNKVT